MSNPKKNLLGPMGLLAIVLAWTACGMLPMQIDRVIRNPNSYCGSVVKIKGLVIDLDQRNGYEIAQPIDNIAPSIWVKTPNPGMRPARQTTLSVSGLVNCSSGIPILIELERLPN